MTIATTPSGSPTTEARQQRRAHGRGKRRATARRLGWSAVSLVVFVAAWWGVTATGLVAPLFLPSPFAVGDAFIRANSCYPVAEGSDRIVCGEQNYFLWQHLLSSLQRIGVGVGAGIVVGILVGFVIATFRPLGAILEPYINFLRALPPLGYIGLLIVWFGIGDTSKIWLLFLAAFPPIALATIAGVGGIRSDKLQAARSLGASPLQVTLHVVLPSSLPSIVNGVRIATGFAWTTVVAAELNNGIPGIGALAYLAGTQLQTPLTIACIIVIGIAAVALDAIVKNVGALLIPWQGKA